MNKIIHKILSRLLKNKAKKPNGPIPIPFPFSPIIENRLDFEKIIVDIELAKHDFFLNPKEKIEERLYYSFSRLITECIKDKGFMEFTKTELPDTIKIRGTIYIGRRYPPIH